MQCDQPQPTEQTPPHPAKKKKSSKKKKRKDPPPASSTFASVVLRPPPPIVKQLIHHHTTHTTPPSHSRAACLSACWVYFSAFSYTIPPTPSTTQAYNTPITTQQQQQYIPNPFSTLINTDGSASSSSLNIHIPPTSSAFNATILHRQRRIINTGSSLPAQALAATGRHRRDRSGLQQEATATAAPSNLAAIRALRSSSHQHSAGGSLLGAM
jgi:hypothetical protein